MPKGLPPPLRLCTGCSGQQWKEEEPSEGTGDKPGPGRIISQQQGLALSPRSSKKQIMRLPGRRSRVRIPGGLSFPS